MRQVELAINRSKTEVLLLRDRILADLSRQLDESWKEAHHSYQDTLASGRHWLDVAEREVTAMMREITAQGLGPTLKRGFALVRTEDGRPVSSAAKARKYSRLKLEFHDGSITVSV